MEEWSRYNKNFYSHCPLRLLLIIIIMYITPFFEFFTSTSIVGDQLLSVRISSLFIKFCVKWLTCRYNEYQALDFYPVGGYYS